MKKQKIEYNVKVKASLIVVLLVGTFLIGFAVGGAGDITLDDTSVFEGDVTITGVLSAPNLPDGIAEYSFTVGLFPNGSCYAVNGSTQQYVESWTSTNASFVFNSVSSALIVGGGQINIKKGVYVLDTPILVQDGLHFVGETQAYDWSVEGSVLRLSNWVNCSIIYPRNLTGDNNNLIFERLTFHGTGASQSAGDLIYLQKCNFVEIRNCWFLESYRDMIRFETGTAQGVIIDNCWFQGAYRGSCLYAGTMTDSVVKDNMFIPANTGSYNGTSAVELYSVKVKFVDNIVTNSYQHGVYLAGGYNYLSGNFIHTNRMRGIAIDTGDNNVIVANTISNNGQYGAGNYPGIDVYNSADNNVISNNICLDNQGGGATQLNGIWIRSGCDYNVLVGNSCTGNTAEQILNDEPNTAVHSCFNGTDWVT